jgi:hypothetical protein
LRAHVEISRISDHVVSNLHNVAPKESATTGSTHHLDKALALLEDWRHGLPAGLSLTREGLSKDPACCLIHMLHNNLLIVATRSWLLEAVKDRLRSAEEPKPPTPYLKICMAAARHTIRLARHMLLINRPRKLLYSGLHFIYAAAVCVVLQELVYASMMQPEELTAGTRMVDFVIERFEEEARLGSSYGRDNARTLRELRSLVMRIRTPLQSHMEAFQDATRQESFAMGGTPVTDPTPSSLGGESLLYDDLMLMIDVDWQLQ